MDVVACGLADTRACAGWEMRRIVELTDREIEIERDNGLNLRLRDEGFKIGHPDHPIDREPIKGGTRFIQDE